MHWPSLRGGDFQAGEEVIVKKIGRALVVLLVLANSAVAAAQTYSPIVTMSVATPDGQTLEIKARDSAVAVLTLKDGTAYELRPTVHDEPFSKVTVAIFKAPTSTESTVTLGEVQVKAGAASVDSKTKPNFKIAVTRIDAGPPNRPQSR
jgi:hypothetical protein